MSDRDEAIGQNLTRFRGERTQQDIADAMRSLGYKWSQATVWAVEKGERPMRLTEAIDVAGILGVDVSDMVSTRAEGMFRVALRKMMDAYENLGKVVSDYEDAQLLLAMTADAASISENQAVETRDWLNLTAARVAERVDVGKKIASGQLWLEKDPKTGEILGRGPWFDHLLLAWQIDGGAGPHGEHSEEG